MDGFSFEEIASKRGISQEDVVAAWKGYVEGRYEMSEEEQWVLHLIRLERLLTQVNDRLSHATRAEDFEIVLKLLDRVELLQGLNKTRKADADAVVQALTRQQTQLVLGCFLQLQSEFKTMLTEAFDGKTTIKALRGTVLDAFDTNFSNVATKALTARGDLA